MNDMIKIMDIKSEVDLQSKHPHVKAQYKSDDRPQVKNNIEHELFYQQHGRYPDADEDAIPEEISDRAMEIEEYLSK